MRKVFGVDEIHDNGEFVTLVLQTGSVVHLATGQHSLTVHTEDKPEGGWSPKYVTIDYHAN